MEIDTPIKFHECNSMANDTGGGVHRARAHVQSGKAHFPESKFTF